MQLSIEDLKNYQKQNPVKFEQKFADLDLDNIPEGFNSMTYRKEVVKGTQEKYLKDLVKAKELKEKRAEVVEQVIIRDDSNIGVQDSNVEGGETLENNKEE